MVNVNIKHMRRVRSKGTTYWYHRKSGERLPDDETARIRRALEINEGLDTPSTRVRIGSLEAVANLYRAHRSFTGLAEKTRVDYNARLKFLCSLWGDEQISSIQRRHVIALQDKLADKPATADRTVTVLRILMDFAVEREYRDDNPAKTIKKLHKPSDVEGHMPWPDAEIEKFLAVHAGTTMGLSVMLGLYTGQRQGDVLRMRWSDITIDAEGVHWIKVEQGKTGRVLDIRLHSELVAVLEATEKRSLIILTTKTGRRYSGSNFRQRFSEATKAAGIKGLTFHGLRYASAGTLAEIGTPTNQIASHTGHKSLAMVQKYSSGAEQRKLNSAAILRWEEHTASAKVENRSDGSGKLLAKSLKINDK